ncbi:hypothetical protein [uncultured Anaerococcus sp.]|uniref:hypothetical protein n=1 Tax=uncultured Anaerococcus sp. TaxID=293428 RepID=UPI00261F5817|nr:hypothetical protein [uncultured Anaerococcus sp.]
MGNLNNKSILSANAKVTVIKQFIRNRQTEYRIIGTFNALRIENKGYNSNLTSRDRKDIDKVTCYILKVLKELDSEDIIIRNDDEKNIVECNSLKQYQEKYDAHVITTSDVYDFGNPDMWYTRIGAK